MSASAGSAALGVTSAGVGAAGSKGTESARRVIVFGALVGLNGTFAPLLLPDEPELDDWAPEDEAAEPEPEPTPLPEAEEADDAEFGY